MTLTSTILRANVGSYGKGKHSVGQGAMKIMALAIVEANGNETKIDELCEATGYCRDHVQVTLRAMSRQDLITVVRLGAFGNIYRLNRKAWEDRA